MSGVTSQTMSIPDIARMTRYSPRQLQRLAARGKIPSMICSTPRYRFKADQALKDWMVRYRLPDRLVGRRGRKPLKASAPAIWNSDKQMAEWLFYRAVELSRHVEPPEWSLEDIRNVAAIANGTVALLCKNWGRLKTMR